MISVKLANIQLTPQKVAADHPELYVRTSSPIKKTRGSLYKLLPDAEYDFSTYFNSFSLEKWLRYTCVKEVELCIEFKGEATLQLLSLSEGKKKNKHCLGEALEISHKTSTVARFSIPACDAPLVSFSFTPKTECTVKAAWYQTEIEDTDIRPVHLSVVMTTFNNEKYLLPNLNLFEELLQSDDPLSKALSIHIVDNGKTLNAQKFAQDHFFIHPNKNTGGAGGFARGMLESLKQQPEPTHVLLMDDDVSITTESLKLNFNFLRLLKKEYEDLCVSGAMLMLEKPHIQHEDVGYVSKSGAYTSLKPQYDLSDLKAVISNETFYTEAENIYSAWWYCCIPAKRIKEAGLPLPLFLRCDDVEYGLRLKPTIVTLNGICVWHASFEGRFRASIDRYQYTRNFLIANAINEACSEKFIMLRFKRSFHQDINTFAYNNATLLLDALDDYLEGPEFIKYANGAKLLKVNGELNERLAPLADIEVTWKKSLDELYRPPVRPHNSIRKFISSFVYNPHNLPGFVLLKTPVVINYNGQSCLSLRTKWSRHMISLNTLDKTGALRTIDKAQYACLMRRYKLLIRKYNKKKKLVAETYRGALEELSSHDYWRSHLGYSEIGN
ncbi:MAG: glycosyltransferase [Coriobacteriia bacterium]|nr:glycosyltransferase [Coriobacteriia bacterium]MCL2749535.1 glycosyltransferase [Coriobacteriia bacterium]